MNYQRLKRRLISAILFTMMAMTLLSFMARASAQDRSLYDIDRADNEVAENSSAGATVGITARADNPDNDTYTLSDSAGGLFAIDPQSGVVTVAASMLDHEAFSSHTITVQARNNGDRRLSGSFVVQVTDVNEPIGLSAPVRHP